MQLNHSFWDGVNAQEIMAEMIPAADLDNGAQGEVWRQRAIHLLKPLTRIAVTYRDHGIKELSAGNLREMLKFEILERVAWQSPESLLRYPQVKADLNQLQAFLETLPGYDKTRIGQQAQTTREQFGFLAMQLIHQVELLNREQTTNTLIFT